MSENFLYTVNISKEFAIVSQWDIYPQQNFANTLVVAAPLNRRFYVLTGTRDALLQVARSFWELSRMFHYEDERTMSLGAARAVYRQLKEPTPSWLRPMRRVRRNQSLSS